MIESIPASVMSFYHQLMHVADKPWLLALLIVLGTFILEDMAIITAALLGADGLVSAQLAFTALVIGIFLGDLGLYAIGRTVQRFHRLKRLLDLNAVHRAHGWLREKMTTTVLFVRVIPGLRLPVYTACGFFKLPWKRFTALVLLASVVWTAAVYFSLFSISSFFWADLGAWKWALMPAMVCVIVLGRKKIRWMHTS